eukprot:3013749-Amphidinium_carterae.1
MVKTCQKYVMKADGGRVKGWSFGVHGAAWGYLDNPPLATYPDPTHEPKPNRAKRRFPKALSQRLSPRHEGPKRLRPEDPKATAKVGAEAGMPSGRCRNPEQSFGQVLVQNHSADKGKTSIKLPRSHPFERLCGRAPHATLCVFVTATR